jgi:proteasome lid subunit RPN8/RPN11
VKLDQASLDEIVSHARQAAPEECCGLIGRAEGVRPLSVYRLRNLAPDPLTGYEASAEDLFAAQRLMRGKGESLFAIYHSHPRASYPVPSATDIDLAFYPDAIYLIVGLGSATPTVKAFSISEKDRTWFEIPLQLTGSTE